MKKISIILLFLMVCGVQTYSQTATLQTLASVSPGPVQVNLSLTGFVPDIAGLQFSVRFDSTILTYVNASDWFPGATGTLITVSYGPNSGTITFVDGYVPALSINGLFCKLNFMYVGPGCTNLTFSNHPTAWLIFDTDYNEYTVSYINGQVCGVFTGIDDNTVNNSSVEIFPTIAKDKVNIKYNVPENGKITFGIYNLMGDEIQKITKECIEKTESTQEMNVAALNSGIYFIKYQIETANINTIRTEKITVTR